MPALPPSEAVTLQATITAINPQTREVTLQGATGSSVTLQVSDAVRLELLKVGDTVDAQYYRSVAFLIGATGQPVPESGMAVMAARNPEGPGGAGVRVTRLSAIVVGIDLPGHRVDIVEPKGGPVRTVTVTEPERIAMLPKLKVGDTVTAVIREALAVSITPAGKK